MDADFHYIFVDDAAAVDPHNLPCPIIVTNVPQDFAICPGFVPMWIENGRLPYLKLWMISMF